MPAQSNLNVRPYYDDFDPRDNFYKILYKAGFPVQARELTQSQTIQQDQLEKISSRFFTDGDTIVMGEFSYNSPVSYVRLSSITQGTTVEEYLGCKLTGASSGVQANVIHVEEATDEDDITFYINYISESFDQNNVTQSVFIEGEIIETNTPDNYTAVVGVDGISRPLDSKPTGVGSIFSVDEGDYYVNGSVIRCDNETIVLDKYSLSPTYEIGFEVIEEFVNSTQDESLLDNSQGSSNFAAPGADRLKISLALAKRPFGTSDSNFVNLATVQQGQLLGRLDQNFKWQWLFDILAKRTFDESGDYIVRDFPINTLEYWNAENVDGVWDPDGDGLYPPIPGSGDTELLTLDQADDNYSIQVDAGLAYVQGYEVGLTGPIYLYGKKPRTTTFYKNSLTFVDEGLNAKITRVYGAPDIQNIRGSGVAEAHDNIITYRNFNDGFVGDSVDGLNRPLNFGNAPVQTYHLIFDTSDINNAARCAIIAEGIPFADAVFTSEDQQNNWWVTGDNICFISIIRPDTGETATIVAIARDANSMVVVSDVEIQRGDIVDGSSVFISTKIDPVPSGFIKPRYFKPETKIDSDNGSLSYSSTYAMGILSSVYFTEFAVIPQQAEGTDWVVGDLVFGETSGAFGIVEKGSRDDLVLVSNIVGDFRPGEEIIQGDKVSRIMTEGEISHLHFTDGGFDGLTFDLSGETGIKLTSLGTSKTLLLSNGEIICEKHEIRITEKGKESIGEWPFAEGSALSGRVNIEVETIPNVVKGYAVQPSFKISNTISKTKSFFSSLADTNDFSADISISNADDADIKSLANNASFSGSQFTNFVTCDDFNGDPSDELVAGDVVTFVVDTNERVKRIVLFCTKPFGYGADRSPARIYFTTSIPNDITSKPVERTRFKSGGKPQQTLIYQLPQKVVKSTESDPDATNFEYFAYREIIVDVDTGVKSFSISSNRPNEIFVEDLEDIDVTVMRNREDPTDFAKIEGRHLKVSNLDASQDSGRKMDIDFTFQTFEGLMTGIPAASTLKVICKVFVTDAVAKRKIYKKDFVLDVPASLAESSVVSLGKADILKVKSITRIDDNNQLIDLTDNYTVDNGQRDNYYGLGRIILNSGVPLPTSDIQITFDYLEHRNDGDFFTADSYTHDDGIDYGAIPSFIPNVTRVEGEDKNTIIPLRDCVDFRPTVNAEGDRKSMIATITPGLDSIDAANFLNESFNGDGDVNRLPVPGTNIRCDVEYYLAKYDTVFLDKSGAFSIVSGEPASSPVPPADISTGIRLYDVLMPAYTFSMKNVKIKKFNYKVYKMKDIAQIDRRLDRVEELVALSLLEQAALNFDVRDGKTGLDRFKNGVVVDAFNNHSKGDVNNSQYRASVDPHHTHLRSTHFSDIVTLEERSRTVDARLQNNYVNNNGIITLPYSNVSQSSVPTATRKTKLQNATKKQFTGFVTLSPSVDDWYDLSTPPRVIIDDSRLYDAVNGSTIPNDFKGYLPPNTVWGDWETNATPITTNNLQNGSRGKLGQPVESQRNNIYNIQSTISAKMGTNAVLQDFTKNTTAPLIIGEAGLTVTDARNDNLNIISPATGMTLSTSFGDKKQDIALMRTMRSIPVKFRAEGLKPNSRHYAFFDNIDVSAWCSPDIKTNDFNDGKERFMPNSNRGFGFNLVSDTNGTISGIFIIPNGRAPLTQSVFSNMADLELSQTGPSRTFPIGTRRFRMTTDPNGGNDPNTVDAVSDGVFTASMVIPDRYGSIISTRIPQQLNGSNTYTDNFTVREFNRYNNEKAPLAQTFYIDSNNPDGVFVTELDLYFNSKDPDIGVELAIVTTDGEVPTSTVVPHSRVIKYPDTVLRVVATLVDDVAAFQQGTTFKGEKSGAVGTLKSFISFQSENINSITNVKNKVYNVVFSENAGEFIPGERIIPSVSPVDRNTFTIIEDEFIVHRADIVNPGRDYVEPIVVFSDPELPAGKAATGEALFDEQGRIYEIILTNPGTGYMKPPTASIVDNNGPGNGATLRVLTNNGYPAVSMGISTSLDASTRTKFVFDAPVYLQGDTVYAFVVKCATSNKYVIYTSELGKREWLGVRRVTKAANTGSIYYSLPGGDYKESLDMDFKYDLKRASFVTNTGAYVKLQNEPLDDGLLQTNPIETNAFGTDIYSDVFGENSKVVRISQRMNGLTSGDYVKITGVVGDPGGIPNDSINGLREVVHSSIDYFTIMTDTDATETDKSGGAGVKATYNRPYEIANVMTGAVVVGSSTLGSNLRSTYTQSVTGYNRDLAYSLDDITPIQLTSSHYFDEPMSIYSKPNESLHNSQFEMNQQKSFQTTIFMISDDEKVSPMIDLDRTDAVVIRNLIDNPKKTDPIYGVESKTITFYGPIDQSMIGTDRLIPFLDKDGIRREVQVKKVNYNTGKATLAGKGVSHLNSSAQFLNDTLSSYNSRMTVPDRSEFFDETSSIGSAYSKWISRLFVFENPSDGLTLKLSCIFYSREDIRVYYRPRGIGFDGDVAEINWIPFNADGKPDNYDFLSPRSNVTVDPDSIDKGDWQSLTWSVQDTAEFDAIAIKIVMTSENPSKCPIIDDMIFITSE